MVAVGIFNYKNIIQDFQEMNFCQPRSDNIKFLNRIFVNQDDFVRKSYKNKLETIEIGGMFLWKNYNFNDEFFKKALTIAEPHELKKFLEKNFKLTILSTNKIKFHITKQPVSSEMIEFNMECFVILTEVGMEMYSLLEDEIENYPIEYLEAIIDDERYKNFGLIYEIQS